MKVRIVEMQRNVVKQLGFNLGAVLNQIGEPQYLLGSLANFAVNGDFLGGFSGGYNLDTTRQPAAQEPYPYFTGNYDGAGAPIYETRMRDVVLRDYPLASPRDNGGSPGLKRPRAPSWRWSAWAWSAPWPSPT